MREHPIRRSVFTLFAVLALSAPSLFAGAIRTSDFGDLGKIDVPRAGDKSITWERGAEAFARGLAPRRGGSGAESFKTRRVREDELGQVHIRLSQTIAGLPVAGVELIVHADRKSGKVLGVNGNFVADRLLPRQPEVDGRAAIDQALAELGMKNVVVDEPSLTYVVDEQDDVVLAWVSLVRERDTQEYDLVYANARTGAAVRREPQQGYIRNRNVHDCTGGQALPCTLVLTEGGSHPDPTVMAAYNNSGTFYNYFSAVHGRDSWNGSGGILRSAVHRNVPGSFAGWINSLQMTFYSDGDGSTYSPLAYSQDVVVHEFTHGVTYDEADMPYTREPGAVNEAFSDIFAAAAKAWTQGGVLDTSVWQIAEDVYTPTIGGDALRYLNDPARAGHPDYYPERPSFNATHENTGPANLAFYLLVVGGQHPRGDTTHFVKSIGMNAAERIFYRALTVYAYYETNYRLLREHTLRAAADLYGEYSVNYNAVANAWHAVGNNWQSADVPFLGEGESRIHGGDYTSTISGAHTGQLYGPPGSNFNLYLERYQSGTWVQVDNRSTSSTNETLASAQPPGLYRWRVHALVGSGQYYFFWNRPK